MPDKAKAVCVVPVATHHADIRGDMIKVMGE